MEIKRKGNRYYYYSWEQMRSFPIKKDKALVLIQNGEATLVDRFMMEPTPEIPTVIENKPHSCKKTEMNNVINFNAKREERIQRRSLDEAKDHFINHVIPKMSVDDIRKLADLSREDSMKFEEELMKMVLKVTVEEAVDQLKERQSNE
ncbi:hypothetical protein G3M81_23285 [Bacillus paralicheniformis]|jgi:hypothetical protein|uniref:hypothetical protein n=1 Tax=Bacillus TaxID=1386 RepID=UPI0013EEB472|nr:MULTISPECIES: hypothetical protein [Bacillus]QII26920.1 hypothetical protein G3M80_20700 [Bacillus altitudinis]QII51485.1 hypothetical protein G3M81_23285 [Bacillus paralicheniformis]